MERNYVSIAIILADTCLSQRVDSHLRRLVVVVLHLHGILLVSNVAIVWVSDLSRTHHLVGTGSSPTCTWTPIHSDVVVVLLELLLLLVRPSHASHEVCLLLRLHGLLLLRYLAIGSLHQVEVRLLLLLIHLLACSIRHHLLWLLHLVLLEVRLLRTHQHLWCLSLPQ